MKVNVFYRFSGPSIAVMLALLVVPVVMAAWFGLHYMTYTNINHPRYVGLQNFRDILADPQFGAAVEWTGIIIAVTVPTSMVLGFVMALLVDQLRGAIRGLFIAGYLLPMLIVPVIGAVTFRQLVEPSGIGTWLYRSIFHAPLELTSTSMKLIILFNTIWLITPFAFIIFFAGLQTVPDDLTEAAAIDGTNRWQHIRFILIPHLRTLIILTGLINVMDIFRIFDNVFILTNMNPVYQADSVMTYIYRTAIDTRMLGLGNAMSIVTVVAIMIVLIPFLYLTYREQREGR